MRTVTTDQAVQEIPPGATVAVSGGGYRVAPEGLLAAVERRFERSGGPRGLTVVCMSMVERSRAGRGGKGTGLNRLARPGLMTRLVCSSFNRARDHEVNAAINAGELVAHNMPMGTLVQWLRAVGTGQPGLLTQVGLETFLDPRLQGGLMTAGADAEPLSRIVEFNGEDYLFYPAMPVDVALIKGTTADTRGNVYLDREAYTHGVFHTAMAAHNSGGTVIAEVNRVCEPGSIHPRLGRVPAPMVDLLCVVDEPFEDEQDPALTGEIRMPIAGLAAPAGPRQVIARRALAEAATGAEVNLGAGIPMYDVPLAAVHDERGDLYFTIEQGPVGGLPKVGGVARNPAVILDSLDVFDYYEGGGPDISILSFGQLDAAGNVNVSRFGPMMPGCGGFPNIAHRIPKLVFCGTLTTGGLDEVIGDGRLDIVREGSTRRLVDAVEQITFNGRRALEGGQQVTVVTERAVFRLTGDGLLLTEVAPGVDIDADVRGQIAFPIQVTRDHTLMDTRYFS